MRWRVVLLSQSKGMTMMEMMVVLGIIATLLGMASVGLMALRANYDLVNATNQLYTDLEWVRQQSIGRAHRFGIQFPNPADSYTVFEDVDNEGDFDPNEEIRTVDLRGRGITLHFNNVDLPLTLLYSRKGTPNHIFAITLLGPHSNVANNVNVKRIAISRFKIRITQ